MATDNQYSTPLLACDPKIRGTAICHTNGKCSQCGFAARHEVKVYLSAQSKALGCTFEASSSQLDRMAQDMSLYGVPVCLCKAYNPDFMLLDSVSCPCEEARKDIEINGRCHCGIFKRA